MHETEKIWMNGELVDWPDAKVHVAVHGLHYGTGVFEGIRCYETPRGPAVFRLSDHLRRLHDSARLLYMEIPSPRRSCARRLTTSCAPTAWRPATCGRSPSTVTASWVSPTAGNPVDTVIISWPWGAYLGEDSQTKGITAKVSSWQRVGANVIPHVAKATGIYLNSMLATSEARRARLRRGDPPHRRRLHRRRGRREHLRRQGRCHPTPPLATSILPGITRDTVIQIAQDLGYVVEETNMIRSDLALADEVFMTGTATEVAPIRAVDDIELGVGPVTRELQAAYLDTVNGRSERWSHWLDVVETARANA